MLNMMLISVVSRLINEKRRWDGKPSGGGGGVSFVKGWGCILPLLGGLYKSQINITIFKSQSMLRFVSQ